MSDGERPVPDGTPCARCGETGREPVTHPPFPNDLGQRIVEEICAPCWEDWKGRQMLLINHYGLKVRDPRAREFLVSNLLAFLFGEGGEEAEIDTTREGEVAW